MRFVHTDTTSSKLGYIPATQYFPPEDWGIEPWQNEKGNHGRIVIHRGIVIPLLDADGQGVLRLRIRKDDGSDPPYVLVKGSSTTPFFIGTSSGCDTVVVVESELDAFLLHQDAGDLVSIIALGSVTCQPDIKITMATEYKILFHRIDYLERENVELKECINELKEYNKSSMGDTIFLIGLVLNMKAQLEMQSSMQVISASPSLLR